MIGSGPWKGWCECVTKNSVRWGGGRGGEGGGGGEWVIWSQGKWNPSFRATGQSLRSLCCGGNSSVIRGHEQRGRRSRRVKDQAAKPGSRSGNDKSGCKLLSGIDLRVIKRQWGTYEGRERLEKERKGRWKAAQRHIGGNIQPEKKKKMNERADSSHSCLLFPVISSSLGAVRILRAGPLLEFTVQWASHLIKHMWTCRGMGRVTVLRTAFFSAAEHARACAGKSPFTR